MSVLRAWLLWMVLTGLLSDYWRWRHRSWIVTKVLCMGAKQNHLPLQYQKMLQGLETNNYAGPIPIMDRLKDAIEKLQNGTQ